MKTNKLFLAILIPGLFLTSGCNRCVTSRPEPPAPLSFYLVDEQGNSLYASASAQYHPDSLSLTLDNEPFTYIFSGRDESLDNVVFETYPVMYHKNGVRLMLHHSKENVDTLDITYSLKRTPCFTNYSYNTIYYNGKKIEPHPTTGHLQLPLQDDAQQHSKTALLD